MTSVRARAAAKINEFQDTVQDRKMQFSDCAVRLKSKPTIPPDALYARVIAALFLEYTRYIFPLVFPFQISETAVTYRGVKLKRAARARSERIDDALLAV